MFLTVPVDGVRLHRLLLQDVPDHDVPEGGPFLGMGGGTLLVPCLAGSDGGFQGAVLGIAEHGQALGEQVIGEGVLFIHLHPGRLHPHLQDPVFRLDKEHTVHRLERNRRQVKLFRLGKIPLAGISDESNRECGCHRLAYAEQSFHRMLPVDAHRGGRRHTAAGDGIALAGGEVVHKGLGSLREVPAHVADGGGSLVRHGRVRIAGLLVVVGGGPVTRPLVDGAAAGSGGPEVAQDQVGLPGESMIQFDRLAGGVGGLSAHRVLVAEQRQFIVVLGVGGLVGLRRGDGLLQEREAVPASVVHGSELPGSDVYLYGNGEPHVPDGPVLLGEVELERGLITVGGHELFDIGQGRRVLFEPSSDGVGREACFD